MNTSLWTDLQQGALLLTANRRLARYYSDQYLSTFFSPSRPSLAAPPITALTDWLKQLWQFDPTDSLLTPSTALLLWENVLSKNEPSRLSNSEPGALAQLAYTAFENLHEYNLDSTHLELHSDHEDVAWFHQQACYFQEILQQKSALTEAMLACRLTQSIGLPHPLIPSRIYLYGFEALTPSMKKFLDRLEMQTNIIKLSIPPIHSKCHRFLFRDTREEIWQMAQACKQQWRGAPKIRIGCIVPALTQHRQLILNTFETVFEEHSALYNISAGTALFDCPLIKTAIIALGAEYPIQKNILHELLHSPYLSTNSIDLCFAALLDKTLLKTTQAHFSLSDILNACQPIQPLYPNTSLPHRLQNWLNALMKRPQSATHARWVMHFCQELNALNWAQKNTFNSTEHQQYEHWLTLLDEFRQQQAWQDTLTSLEASSQLRWLSQNELFQGKTPPAPIQVLGTLEAIGLPFDYLWFMGLDADHWPAPPRPNPLLPYALQQQYGMPHATANRELEYCQWITQTCMEGASEVIISSTQWDGEKRLTPSSLIEHIPLSSYPYQIAPFQLTSGNFETIPDEAPPLAKTEVIRGGTQILQYQAHCPFLAFAKIRLKADSLPPPESGFNAQERGIHLHKALAYFWRKTQTQDELCKLTEKTLLAQVDAAISHSLHAEKQAETFFQEAERERLRQLLLQWLSLEKERPAFRVIAVEQRGESSHLGLSLYYTIDRLDQLENGSYLLIDYKSSKQSLWGWFNTPLSLPQMPFYATSLGLPIQALSFAELKRGELRFNGISANSTDIVGIKLLKEMKQASTQSWQKLETDWQVHLRALSTAFLKGHAELNPHPQVNPCQYCDLQSLCRVNV